MDDVEGGEATTASDEQPTHQPTHVVAVLTSVYGENDYFAQAAPISKIRAKLGDKSISELNRRAPSEYAEIGVPLYDASGELADPWVNIDVAEDGIVPFTTENHCVVITGYYNE